LWASAKDMRDFRPHLLRSAIIARAKIVWLWFPFTSLLCPN
jgi:hypothetical protein